MSDLVLEQKFINVFWQTVVPFYDMGHIANERTVRSTGKHYLTVKIHRDIRQLVRVALDRPQETTRDIILLGLDQLHLLSVNVNGGHGNDVIQVANPDNVYDSDDEINNSVNNFLHDTKPPQNKNRRHFPTGLNNDIYIKLTTPLSLYIIKKERIDNVVYIR